MKTGTVKLADNKDYVLSTLNVGDLIDIEKKFGSINVDTAKTENVVYWVWLSIKKHHKEMKLEDLYELIDAPFIAGGGMNKLFEVLSLINGWDKSSKNVSRLAEEKQVSAK